MPLVSQAIDSLIAGVSQQPLTLRDISSLEEQINGISRYATGLSKRPPADHTSVLSAVTTAAYDSVNLHTVARSSTDRYRVILSNGDLKVFDALTGTEQAVTFPDGKAYLATADPGRDFRCVTVGDATYVLNRTVAVQNGTEASGASRNEALVCIRSADFLTKYTVTLNDATVTYTTVSGDKPSDRVDIGTEKIAEALRLLILANAAMSAFSVTRYGSTLYIKRTNGADFSISASDGLADEGIRAIKKSVQRFEDLPERAKNGFVVEVNGDPTNQFDNYYVKYADNGLPNLAGVWKETVKPGILTSLDETTMPHKLARGVSLLDGITVGSTPNTPTVEAALSGDTVYAGWTARSTQPPSEIHTVAYDDEQYQVGMLNNDYFSTSLAALNGSEATIEVRYSAYTKALSPVDTFTVELWVSNAPSVTALPSADYTKVDSKIYRSTMSDWVDGDTLSVTGAYPSNTRIQIRVVNTYAVLGTTRRGLVNIYGKYPITFLGRYNPEGIAIDQSTGSSVTFEPLAVFPAGVDLTISIGATPYTYTTITGDTGTDVAVALAALINAGAYTATNPDPGVVEVSGTPFPVLTADSSFDGALTLFNDSLALTPAALVGETVTNTSDGSSGTITANTINTISVTALTGGATNTFQSGDVVTVTGADASSYTFAPALWKSRAVGDAITVPAPSIVGRPIDELFYHRNRLGFAAQQKIVMSVAADPLNLFRQSATKLLPSDPIDVQSATQRMANFHSAVEYEGKLMLWSSNAQTIVDGEPTMTPETISLSVKSEFNSTTRMRPIIAGNKMFFARADGAACRVFEYGIVDQTGQADADDITRDVPTYIRGTPIAMAADNSLGFMALLTDDDQSVLWIYNYHYNSQTRVQGAWSKWQFAPGTSIVALDIVDGKLGMVVVRPLGVYIESIDLDPGAAPTGLTRNIASLDRRITSPAAPQVGLTVAHRITLGYKIATDGSEGELVIGRISTGELLDESYISRADTGSVDISNLGDIGADCIVGVLYDTEFTLSTFMKTSVNRSGQTEVDTRGRLQLRYLTLKLHETTDATATVTLDGRDPYEYVYRNSAPDRPALHRFPVLGRNTTAVITVSDSGPGSLTITGAEWEGHHTTISRRV